METKFEKLPEDVRNLILEINQMKEKNRQNLEYLRRTNLRSLDELSEDVQACRLVMERSLCVTFPSHARAAKRD